MYSSQKRGIIWTIYNSADTVFTLSGIALLLGETNFQLLNQKLNYYVRTGKLVRPRKGIYAKPNYNPEELTCVLYTPSYISLEYVLQKAGVVFQYDSHISAVSYLSRSVDVENYSITYRKIKSEILVNTSGIKRERNINIATPERAFLDMLYLNGSYYFDNLHPLNEEIVRKLLPVYGSKKLNERVTKLLQVGKR